MTEKEKMLRGMLYDADDSTLCADRVRAKELCHAYNQLRPSDAAGMRELLQRLLGETGETFCVTAPFWCDYGYNIRLGEYFYANHNLVILDCVAGHSANTCSWRRTAGFTRPATRSTPSAASGGWSMLTRSPWAIMCGSAAACRSCPASRSGAMS